MDLIDTVNDDEEVNAAICAIRANRSPHRMPVTVGQILLVVADLREENRHKRNGHRRKDEPTLDEIVEILAQESDFSSHRDNVAVLRKRPKTAGVPFGGPIDSLIHTAWAGDRRAIDRMWEKVRTAEPLPTTHFELPRDDGARLSEIREDRGDEYDFVGQHEVLSGI